MTTGMPKVTKNLYGLFRKFDAYDIYWVVTDEYGKILSITNLFDGTKTRGIAGTRFYLDYVISTDILFDDADTAIYEGVALIYQGENIEAIVKPE